MPRHAIRDTLRLARIICAASRYADAVILLLRHELLTYAMMPCCRALRALLLLDIATRR